MLDGEVLAPSAPSSLTSGDDLFSRLIAGVSLSPAFYSMGTEIYNSLPVQSVGLSFQFPWRRLPTSDGIKL
jgi:hypothetical protein